MKINNSLLENAKCFYLNRHSMEETRKMIHKKYRIKISREDLRKRLIKIGIKMRDRKEAVKLYFKKRRQIKTHKVTEMYKKFHSIRKITKVLKMGRGTVRRILVENGFRIMENEKAIRLANTKHQKLPFCGTEEEKTYLTGLTKGDITPMRKSKYTLRLTVSTTHSSFIRLLLTLFEKYGPIYVYPTKQKMCGYQWNISIELDAKSFNFLLNVKNKNNITLWANKTLFIHFLAGIIDSDGSVFIRKTGKYIQYVIRVFNEDLKLLESMKHLLKKVGFNPSLYINSEKGESRIKNDSVLEYNENYYILELSRKKEVVKILKLLHIRHPEKVVWKEIIFKLESNHIIYSKNAEKLVKSLRNKIAREVRQCINEAKIAYEIKKRLKTMDQPLMVPIGLNLATIFAIPDS